MKRRDVLRGIGAAVTVAVVIAAVTALAAQADNVTVSGTLLRGQPGETPYTAMAPAAWNGTLVLDLDFVSSNPAQRQWFLEHGYAIGGIRRANNEASYAMRDYVANLLAVRQALSDKTGRLPSRTIAMGVSRGAYVALAALEAEPTVFTGALALSGGSLGLVGRMLAKLDRTWALKTLVDPQAPLTLVKLPPMPARGGGTPVQYSEDVALTALVERAKSTPLGRARLMLAAAFDQVPRWGTRGSSLPATEDLDAQLGQVVDNFGGGFNQGLRWAVETAAGGNVSWNEGVDYAAMLKRSGLQDLVAHAYRSANADLEADLRTLARAPRIRADETALQQAGQKLLMNSGRVGGPVLIGTTEGDPAEPPSIESAYADAVRAQCARARGQRCAELVRTAFTRRPGHTSWSLLERVTLFQALVQRLDSGKWETELPQLKASAARLKAGTATDLGDERFVALTPAPALRTWDARDAERRR